MAFVNKGFALVHKGHIVISTKICFIRPILLRKYFYQLPFFVSGVCFVK